MEEAFFLADEVASQFFEEGLRRRALFLRACRLHVRQPVVRAALAVVRLLRLMLQQIEEAYDDAIELWILTT